MPKTMTLAAQGLVLALAWMGTSAPGVAHAQRSGGASDHASRGGLRVAVADLAGRGGAGRAAFADAIRAALAAQPGVHQSERGGADVVLRGSVTEVRRRRVAGQLEVRCEVSLIVAEARGGAIRLMLRGAAGARGGDAARLSTDALRAAVRGALRPLGASARGATITGRRRARPSRRAPVARRRVDPGAA